jgi:hypothetical protein
MVPKEGEKVLFATDIVMLGSLFDCNEYGLPSTFESLLPTTYKLPSNLASTNADADSESYFEGDVDDAYLEGQGPPSISEIKKWICGKNACAINNIAEGGVVAQTPSYQQIIEMLNEYEGINDDDSKKVLEYEDIFPLTEMSGIEWGYNGPGQLASTDDKIFSPGGHFMGLSCNDAETNIKTCVNLKRACEIGTTFSERLEVPIGFNDKADYFDEVNYLFGDKLYVNNERQTKENQKLFHRGAH